METFTFKVTIMLDRGDPGDTMIAQAGTLEEPHYMLYTGAPLNFIVIFEKVMLTLRELGVFKPKPTYRKKREETVDIPAAAVAARPVMSAVNAIRTAARAAKKRKTTLEPAVSS